MKWEGPHNQTTILQGSWHTQTTPVTGWESPSLRIKGHKGAQVQKPQKDQA